ncbi:MAG: hypothetical protein ACRD2A_25380, partial [Vicinamibacterales bacterium]
GEPDSGNRAHRALSPGTAGTHAQDGDAVSEHSGRILYCHCAYAKVVPASTKTAVLNGLSEAGVEFDAVPDLCEMAARGDVRLRELASGAPLTIAACYPRAVKWLFAAAGAELPEQSVRVWNMRVETAEVVVNGLLECNRNGTDSPSVEVG